MIKDSMHSFVMKEDEPSFWQEVKFEAAAFCFS